MNIDQILDEAAADIQAASRGTQTRKASTVKVRIRNQTVISLFVGAILIVGIGTFATGLLPTEVNPAQPSPTMAPTIGPVTLKTRLNLAESPVVGTFEVTAGAEVLGCSSGTVLRKGISETAANHVMTCESGPRAGTFTIYHANPALFVWDVRASSDDFASLQGEGRWDFALTGTGSVVETFTGNIEYTP